MARSEDRNNFRPKIRDDIDLASYIDAALLKTETTATDIEALCRQAIDYHFKAVFVNPS